MSTANSSWSVSAAESSAVPPAPLPPRPLPPELAVTHNAYDTDAWERVLAQAFTLPIAAARAVYERFLSIFPTASRYWRQYILHEQAAHEYARVEALFSRCLLQCLSLPLFQSYIDYVRLVKAGADDEHDAVEKAFDFVLQHMHLDLQSPSIFLSYLSFLSTLPASSPIDETTKMHKQRRVYQRAVVVPGQGVEELWREWDKFEHGVNRVLAVGLLGEWSARHLQAKQVGKERRRRSKHLNADLLAVPPTASTALLHANQLLHCKQLLQYLRSNPMHLSPADQHAMLSFTYRQQLQPMQHQPALWLDYLSYLRSVSEELAGAREEEGNVWKEAVRLLPYSLLMGCMLADWLEEKGRLDEAKKQLQDMISRRRQRARDDKDREEEGILEVKRRTARLDQPKAETEEQPQQQPAITAEQQEEKRGSEPAVKQEAKTAEEKAETQPSGSDGKQKETEAVEDEEERQLTLAEQAEDEAATARSQRQNLCIHCHRCLHSPSQHRTSAQTSQLTAPAPLLLLPLLPDTTLLYIQLMRVVRRCEGQDAARLVFLTARKYKGLQYHCYVFAALLEHRVNRNAEFAAKILHSGLERYEKDDGYVSEYLRWLHNVNDAGNMRVVIERVVKDGEEEGRKRRMREEDERMKGRLKRKRGGAGGGGGKRDDDWEELDVYAQPLWLFGCSGRTEGEDETVTIDADGGGRGIAGVWWRYVQLERWTATELSTIEKAEERREVALGLHSPRIALIVDRLRFRDLQPCSEAMRRTIELLVRPDIALNPAAGTASALASAAANAATASSSSLLAVDAARIARSFPRPDLSLLAPIDPQHPPPDAELMRRRYGGVIGDALISALLRLGPAMRWSGAAYNVDGALRLIRDGLQQEDRVRAAVEGQADDRSRAAAAEAEAKTEEAGRTEGGKRKRAGEQEEDGDEAAAAAAVLPTDSTGDLFGQRRQHKMARQQQ